MKTRYSNIRLSLVSLCALIASLFPITGRATTHTIALANFSFTPSSLNVNVGDTIVWSGDFAAPHNVQSGNIPSGAAPFSKLDQTGSSFSYVVTMVGTYNYVCTLHASLGMTGSFTAVAAGVEPPIEMKMMSMDAVYPNPALAESFVHFMLEAPGHVTLRVFDATGKLTLTAADEQMAAGHHMLDIDTRKLTSGGYQYVLQSGEAVLRRAVIVVK